MKHKRYLERDNVEAKQVLVFNYSGTLIAIFASVGLAGTLTGILPQAISNACIGSSLSSNGMYFRHLDPIVTVESDDIGSLKLKDYDHILGQTRKYRKSKNMLSDYRNYLKNKK